VPATVIPFPSRKENPVELVKHALIVAAVIAAVMLVNNMTGQKLSTALAA
jgi:hypothetical protein